MPTLQPLLVASRRRSSMRSPKLVVLLGVLLGLLLAQQLGVFQLFAEPARVKQTLLGLGPWGQATFVVAYTLLQPFGLPGTVFILAAPLIWPWPTAFALSMLGTMLASVLGFSFARFVARDGVERHVPEPLRKYEAALNRHAFATVFWLRLIFWMPPWLHAFFGVSRVSFATHFWASLAGYLPPILLVSYFGQELFDTLRQLPGWAWLALGLVIVLGAALAVWTRQRRIARAQRSP